MTTFFIVIAAVLAANAITLAAIVSFVSMQRRGVPLLDNTLQTFNTALGVSIKLAAALFVALLLLGLGLGLFHILVGQPA